MNLLHEIVIWYGNQGQIFLTVLLVMIAIFLQYPLSFI